MSGDLELKRLMAIDPGLKRIGIALSDLSCTISRPLCIIDHTSRKNDAIKIIQVMRQNQVARIIMGVSMDEDGNPSLQGRSAIRLAEEIIKQVEIPLEYWDEDFTTNMAKATVLQTGASKKRRKGHHDDLAAAILLQTFIENNKFSNKVKAK
jgi:putative Holliday junction resolvase